MQADVSLVGWAATATVMTDRAGTGPSIDDTADDHALVAAALAGSPAAFDVLVTRHRRGVYQICYRFVNHHEDAADLTQDAFVRAWRGLASFRGQARFSTWLYRIAVNVCLNKVAARQPATEVIDADLLEDRREPRPGDALLARERAAAGARGGGRAAAAPARGAGPAHLSRAVAPGSGRHRRHQCRRREGQRLPCARQPAQAPGRTAVTPCLRPEELVDLVEGMLPAERAAHAAACETCRAAAADLAATWAEARAAEVPEPAPYFWTALSQRVRAAIGEPPPRQGWAAWLRWDTVVPLAGMAALLMALAAAIPRPPAALDRPPIAEAAVPVDPAARRQWRANRRRARPRRRSGRHVARDGRRRPGTRAACPTWVRSRPWP